MNIGRAQTLFDAWQAGAIRENELAEFRNMLPAIFDDAIAWRKGAGVLRELQTRVMPCGHAMENLVRVGKHDVTTCGQCLTDKHERAGLALWFNGADTYVARDATHARELMLAHLGPGSEDDVPPFDDWHHRVGMITLHIEHDIGDTTPETKSAEDWIRDNGAGFLCSTEQ